MSIQSPAKCKTRGVIRYLVWKGKTPVEVYNEVETGYGDKDIESVQVVWRIKNSRTSVHGDQRCGRSSIVTDKIAEKFKKMHSMTITD